LPAIEASGGGKGAGRIWTRTTRTEAPETLASASRTIAGELKLVARVHLIAPNLLYEMQRERSRLFGLIIGAAAITSVIGFASAYRAFRKQHRLAEMKSNFVSSVSHELRAPIASVRLMAGRPWNVERFPSPSGNTNISVSSSRNAGGFPR
jgi:signal transduction histidine kinase